MKKSIPTAIKISEPYIIKAIKVNEFGRKTNDVARELGTAVGRSYQWSKTYTGMEVRSVKRAKELEKKNRLHHNGC